MVNMTKRVIKDGSDEQQEEESSRDEETTVEEDEEEEDEDSGNEEDEDFLSEELNLPETEDDLESDSTNDYPIILDDSEEDRIFKRQLSYPPIPMYHPPLPDRQQNQSSRGRSNNPREKIGVLTPMEEVTEPPSSAATSIDGERRSLSRGRRAGSRCTTIPNHLHLSPNNAFRPPSTSPNSEQKSILKSKENLQEGQNRRVTFLQGGNSSNHSVRSGSPTESLASNTSEYSSMADSGRQTLLNDTAKSEIQGSTIVEEAEETEDAHVSQSTGGGKEKNANKENESKPNGLPNTNKNADSLTENKVNINKQNGENSEDLALISDIEQGEKVIQWQMENAKSETDETPSALDAEFASIVNGIIAELHNLDELIGSFMDYSGVMEMNASKQDHLANVSTQLATYLAQVSPQIIMTNLPQVIPLVTSLLYLTGSNFRSQLASLTAVNVFIERLRDCKTHSGLRVLPHADLTWLVRALCELSSESSRSVLKNEGMLALARLIKTAGPEMVFDPILFILTGNDEKVIRKKRKEAEEEDRILIPTGGPGGAPKIKAIALDSLTFALLTFPRDDFNLNLVAKLTCHCLLHPKRRMRQAALECLSVVSHSLGSHVALPLFRQVIMEEEEADRQAALQNSAGSFSSDASASGVGSASSDPEAEPPVPPKEIVPSKIPIPISRLNENDANQSPKKFKPTGTPISAISARISRHLLPTPSLNDLVEYAVKIPASSKLFSRQSRAVSKQDEIMSGGESGESGGSGSANLHGRRIASSSGTSSSSVTNVELDLEPVLNTIGSGRRKQTNDMTNSVMAADVAWILAGSGPIKPCEGTSVLAPIYRLPERQLISDRNLTHTHIRQLGMLSSGLESDSNSSDQGYSKMQKKSGNGPNGGKVDQNSSGNSLDSQQDPGMGRGYYYQGNTNGGSGMSRGMAMANGGGAVPPDNNNGGRMSSNGSYSLLPNKYSLAGNAMGGRSGGNNMQHATGMESRAGMGMGGAGDPMMSPHHMPGGTYDYSYGGNMDALDGYNSSAMNSADPYDQTVTSLRAPSRAKTGPLQPVHNLRDKYFASSRPNMKPNYSDEDERDINNLSESSASSDEEDDIHSPTALKSDAMMKAERRASQVSNKSLPRGNKNKDSRKSGKTPKSSKHSPKKGQKDGKAPTGEPDKVEQIVNRLQQEYQVYRVELDQTGPSPEELAASKKKRGELDSAGSNSRDSGVSIGAGSVASVHTPSVEQKQPQQSLGSVAPEAENDSVPIENHSQSNSNGIENNNANGKKDGSERTSKRKSSLKSVKKSGASNPKAVHHAIDGDDSLSRNWKSTPDVASILDEYEPHISNYRRMSTEHGINGVGDHDIINQPPYHSSSNIGGAGDGFIPLHRKPVLAGRRQSLSRPQDELERQLALIPNQQPTGRSSRLDYHQHQHQQHPHHRQLGMQNGYGGMPAAGLGLLQHEPDHFHRVSSMLDMDKAPSRESSAGSGNTYSLLQHESLHQHSLSPHLRSSKSTGNLLGVDDIYGGIGGRGGNPYYEMMDHPGSPGRRMLHSRLASHHALADLGNSTDDMEFPMTPQSESSSNTLPKQSRGMITGRMNSKVVPKKIYKGSFREVNARSKASGSMGALNAEMFPLDLKPVSSPKHALPAALLQVQASDWETNVDGFRQLVRLARHHPEFIRSDLHNVNMNALRHVMNLRSQVCRAAILFFRELFMNLGKAMEHDSERIAEKLLDKAADTNKFIREDSGKALEALVLHVSPAKALNCLDLYGTRHRNPAVRSMTARMTTKLIEKLGADRSLSEVPERLLPMLCRFLQEGSLDTRMSAKLAFSVLMESSSFDTQLKRHVPADTLRHVQKSMKAITTKS